MTEIKLLMEHVADELRDANTYAKLALEYKASHLVNRLESHTAAEFWPYPTYADILFSV